MAIHLELSDEQEFLAEAAVGMLGREGTVAAAREALDGRAPRPLWELAVDAGWPGLLIGEESGGAGLGLYEAMLVLEACGGALADAHLLGHLAATAVLRAADPGTDLLQALAIGEQRAALVDGMLGRRARPQTFGAVVEAVLDAPGADVLVAVGEDESGMLVSALVQGAEVVTVGSYDATRSLATVDLRNARVAPLELSPEQATAGRAVQRALLGAESVGAADACLRMARDYALDRRAFGRQIGSYQAIKHKLVEMLRRIESARSLLRYAGDAWRENRQELSLAANAARVLGSDALDYAAPENIFIHGGIGATWEHDAQLYYRRAEVSRRLAGGAEAAAQAVADELLADSWILKPEDER